MADKDLKFKDLRALLEERIDDMTNHPVVSGNAPMPKEDVDATVAAMKALSTQLSVACQQGLLAVNVKKP